MTASDWREVTVTRLGWEADGVVSLILTPTDGVPLPAWDAGAHIDVRLPSGTVRQYSLCGESFDPAYTIAVLREPDGRGGSAEIHDTALIGRTLAIRGPRNHFPLEPAAHHVLIAGGIGITPILALAREATARGDSWELHYRDVVLTSLTGFCGFWGLYGFVTWANALMIKGRDIDAGTAGLVVAIFAVTAVAVKPLVGLVTDRFFGGARKTPSLVIFAVFALTLMWFGNVSSPTAFIWIAPLLGGAAYGWTALLVALIPRLVPVSVTGSAAGIANAIWQLGSVLVPLAVGAVFSATNSFDAAFLTLAAGPALAILTILPVRDRAERRQQASEAEAQEKVPQST